MNSVCLIGNLVRDPELRYSSGSEPKPICRFTLAINDGFGEKKETSYIQIVVFGKSAENCEKYLSKGSKASVIGRIKTGSYTKQDGTKVYTTDVIANNVEFLSSKKPETQEQQSFGQEQQSFGFDDTPSGFRRVDDDIPF